MPCSYYIYYRVDPEKVKTCEPKITALLAAVENATGITGRLLRKRGEPLLWMEVYDHVRDEAQFEWEVADIADQLKVKECLEADTTRHVECFEV